MMLADDDAPAHLARVAEQRVHYLRAGSGSVPIVYVSGLGMWSPHHTVLHEKLSALSDCLLVDRPGYGWSELGTFPRTIEANAWDLHAALQVIGVNGPAIIAGHSYGALVALTYAVLYPDAVKALVLVDGTHPDQWQKLPVSIGQFYRDRPVELMRRAALAAVDKLDLSLDEHAYSLKREQDEKAVRAALPLPALHVAMASELENSHSPPDSHPLRRGQPVDIPMTVLTARYSFEHFIPDRTNDLYKESQEIWLALQQDYLRASRKSRQCFADADHALHVSDPDSIVEAVKAYL